MDRIAAARVAALARGDHFEPGPNGRGLLGRPVRNPSSLPDPATAGVADTAILFGDFESAYRIADRTQGTVQRLIDEGLVGALVKRRVGCELVRPSAVAVYLM